MLYEVQAEYGKLIEEESRHKAEAVAEFDSQARASAARAAHEVARIRAEADEAVASIIREAEEEAQRLEKDRLKKLAVHNEECHRLEEELHGARLAADKKIEEIESQIQAVHESAGEQVLQRSKERMEAVQAVQDEAEEFSQRADEFCRLAIDADKKVKAEMRETLAEAEKQRSIQISEAERSCQVWISAFNQALAETQTSLAERLEQCLQEASAARKHLEDCRERADAHWQNELAEIRKEATQGRLVAAKTLEEARVKRDGLQKTALERAQEGIAECKAIRQMHVSALRSIANELDEIRKGLGMQARDQPVLVQSLKDLASRFRLGEHRPPPKVSPFESFDRK